MANPQIDIPNPDPTIMTTEQLERAVQCLREIIETRLNGMDSRFAQLHADFDQIPENAEKAVHHLEALHTEKFASIQTQFKERDVRVEQTARDTKVAVDAALQAAEKAVGKQNESFALSIAKSETATVKQIDQQGVLIQTTTAALDGKINDIKERLTRIEGSGEGVAASGTTHRAMSSQLISMIAMIVGLAGLVFGIIMAVRK